MFQKIEERIAASRSIVEEQAKFFESRFGRVDSQWKYDGSRVTEADLNISNALQRQLKSQFPEDLFLSEETDPEKGTVVLDTEYTWLVDPIDGTNNFARGIPACAISLALLKDGIPVYGIIYDHMSRSLIHGGPGAGVFVGDRKIQVSFESPSAQSIVGAQHCEIGERESDDRALQRMFKIRNLGSSAIQLAYVSVGWLDGVVAHRVNSWDIAAGVALIREVKGDIKYFDSDPFPLMQFDVNKPSFGYAAGSPAILKQILAAIDR